MTLLLLFGGGSAITGVPGTVALAYAEPIAALAYALPSASVAYGLASVSLVITL